MAFTVRKTTGVAYGPHASHRLDRYRPVGVSGPLPTVLFVHGGGWDDDERAQWDARCNTIVADQGWTAHSMTYRLAPTNTYPKQIDDVALALAWLKSQSYYVDPARIALWGRSAGSYLVAWHGLWGAAKCWIAEAAILDLTIDDARITAMLGGANATAASPMFAPNKHLARPSYLVHGTADATVPYQQAVDMQAALVAAGATSTLRTHSGDHGEVTDPTVIADEIAFLVANL